MSQFIPVELHHASRLLNHGPTVMITSFDEQSQRRNIMAAAWSMPVEFEPPRVAIVVDKSTWTRELIERNGKFGIVIPGVAATNWTWAVGSVSGREEDKFNCYGIPVVRGPVLGLPLVEEKCLAWMECRLLPATSAQEKYDTLFGEVVSAAADARVFGEVVSAAADARVFGEVVSAAADARVFVEGRWQFDDDKLNTLHHLGAGTFVTSGKRVTAG
ncbi:TPA: flavin reductase family protein [Escherichia coli]|nr:flavin reductase family protein [Escherichia coli]